VRKHSIASIAAGIILVMGLLMVPAQARSPLKGNSGHAHLGRVTRTSHAVRAPASFKKFNNPVAQYTTQTCVIDFSGLADGTLVDSVSGCGITVSFSVTMEKATVPGGGWATWAAPPYTETATPAVLTTGSKSKVLLTYSKTGRRVGVEAEPDFSLCPFTSVFKTKSGSKAGKIQRDADWNAGARLFAGQTGSKKANWVKTLKLTCGSGDDFAIAEIRVS
jgi:hypothetical protein